MSPVNIHIFDCYYLWASIHLFLCVAPMCSNVACPLLLKKQRCLTSILRELRYKLVIGMSKFEICIGGCTKIFHTEWVIDDISRRVVIWFQIEYDDDINDTGKGQMILNILAFIPCEINQIQQNSLQVQITFSPTNIFGIFYSKVLKMIWP